MKLLNSQFRDPSYPDFNPQQPKTIQLMKTMFIFLPFILFSNLLFAQNVGVGTSNPNNSAILDISSTDKGLLIPRMTSAQRIAIASPAKGLLVYQTQAPEGFYYNNGTGASPSWIMLGATGPQGPVGATGVIESYSIAGTSAYPSNVLSFITPTITITLQAGQKVLLIATRAMGGYAPAYELGIYPACQSTTPNSPIVNLGLGMFGHQVPANTRIDFSVHGVFQDLPAGTYKFGMSGVHNSPNPWSNTEWAYVTALVF